MEMYSQLLQSAVVGVVQGIAEFLPISSSGHLVIAQTLLGWNPESIVLEVVVHLATTGAVVVFFRKKIVQLVSQWWLLILLASVPAGVVGILFKDAIEAFFGPVLLIGGALIITGLLNFFMDWQLSRPQEPKKAISPQDAFLVGIAQAVAITPGISRSGSTVAAGVGLGLDREKAFEFSFILSIPAILGAAVLELRHGVGEVEVMLLGVAAVTAFLTGLLSLSLLKWMLVKAQLKWFGAYCVVVGSLVVLWQLGAIG